MATKSAYAQYWQNGVKTCVGGGADYWQIDSYNTESAYLFVKPTAMGIPVGNTITNIRIDFQYRQTTYQDKGGIGYSSTFYWRPVYSTAPASGTLVNDTITDIGSEETIKSKFGLSTSYTSVSNKNQNVSVSVSNNTLVGVKFTLDSDNLFDVRLWLKSVSFTVTYTTPTYTVSTAVSPSGSGTVTGTGTYEYGKTATLTATPKTGYKFVKWSDGVTTASRTVTVTGNATYTAYFEIDKTNKIFIGTSQPKAIYIGTQEVKEIYIDTTKVYG